MLVADKPPHDKKCAGTDHAATKDVAFWAINACVGDVQTALKKRITALDLGVIKLQRDKIADNDAALAEK